MKKITLVLLIAVFAGSVMAAQPIATQMRQAKGIGATRDQAVKNALYEAVSQVQGVVVTSGLATSSAAVGSVDITREEVNKSIEMEAISVRAVDTISTTLAQGLVKSYSVLEESRTADGKYEVLLEAEVFDYQSPQASKKMTLAVTAFEVQQTLYRFGNIKIPAAELAAQFSQRLTTLLNDSGRFDVLDRAFDYEFAEEKAILTSGDTDLEQKARVRQVLGADYLLSGRIRRASIIPESRLLPSTGIYTEEYEADFVGEVRLLVPNTRQVAFSHEYRINLETAEVKWLSDNWASDERDFDQIKDAFLDLAARQIVEDVLNDLFPVRVAAVRDNEIILDQGGERMLPDAVYEVYAQGEKIVDPQTQEVLGQDESRIAALRTTRVLPKFSYAEIVDGNKSGIEVGQICRIHPDSLNLHIEVEGGMKSNIQRTPAGGVKLPFD
jgi:hypothetical protein